VFHVVLVAPEIPPNTGNVGRLCLATRTRLHLVEPLGFSLDDRQLKRAGLDYWKDVDCHTWPSLETLQAASNGQGRFHYFTTKAQTTHWSATYGPDDYLVFGCETRGLPESLLRANAADCHRIPTDNVRSLNLSVSVGIVLYEALRQTCS
jgi:tRNA (cytidine/uridine-2'-O-)-methyltransferase